MKNYIIKPLIYATLCLTTLQQSACKGKVKEATTADQTLNKDTSASPGAPVVIAADDELTKNVKDATKDFPTVVATVDSSVVTLSGSISRNKLPKLMMNLNALHPKKINNNLTINK